MPSAMKKIALAVAAAAAFAGLAFATDPLVKELFPWFEVGLLRVEEQLLSCSAI